MKRLRRLWTRLDLRRRWTWFWQRRTRGFDNRELWNLDATVARFTLPRLKAYRKQLHCYPPAFGTMAEWAARMDDMIYALDLTADESKWHADTVDWDRVERGCRLFGEWLRALWY